MIDTTEGSMAWLATLDSEQKKRYFDEFTRQWSHFQLLKDEDLVILKGHLLVEEQLWIMVSSKLKSPEEIKRFSFSQVFSLARAMYDLPDDLPWLWGAIRKLNKLRNLSSHQLLPDDYELHKEGFLSSVPIQDTKDGMNRLKETITAVYFGCQWFTLFGKS